MPVLLALLAIGLTLASCIIDTPTPRRQATPEVAPTVALPNTPTPRSIIQGQRTIKQYDQPPLVTIDPDDQFMATVRTNNGTIILELFASQAPVTVNNFVFLARDGFFNGLTFHRVIPGFMIQTGDPTGTGAGGPGYQIQDEIVRELVFDRSGVLAMANKPGVPNSNGSQFFITVATAPHLNGAHTIFGRVVTGLEIVDSISVARTDARDRPLNPVTIESIGITTSGR